MRLDDQDGAGKSCIHQPLLQAMQIARQRRTDVCVHYSCRYAIELLDLREHIRGKGDVGIRHCLGQRGGSCALVARIAIGVQVADRDRLHVGSLQRGDGVVERGVVERCLDRAVGAHALGDAEAQCAWHELLGRRHAQVVAIVLQALAHLDNVAMAFGGEQADAGTLVLEQRIGGDGGAMHDALGLGQQVGG